MYVGRYAIANYIYNFMKHVKLMGIHIINGKGDMFLSCLHQTILETSGKVNGLAFAHA